MGGKGMEQERMRDRTVTVVPALQHSFYQLPPPAMDVLPGLRMLWESSGPWEQPCVCDAQMRTKGPVKRVHAPHCLKC